MDMKLDIKYRLELSRDEWLVVSKALRAFSEVAGVVTASDRERDLAGDLQEQMLSQKHSALSQMTSEASKHVANVEAAKRKP